MDIARSKEIGMDSSSGNNGKALNDALRKHDKVIVSGGIYLTGPIEIPSHTELVIEEGATLKFIPDFDAYEPIYTRWEGCKCHCMHPMILFDGAEGSSLSGSGTIDGSGEPWWRHVMEHKGKNYKGSKPTLPSELRLAALNKGYESQPKGGGGREMQFLRPPLVQIKDSKDIRIEGLTFINSPFWTIHPLFSERVLLKGLKIRNPANAPNTDGIDIESSTSVTVEDCAVDVGDDAICIKAGSGMDGIKDAKPSNDITISKCTVHAAHGGAVIGSETAAGVYGVTVKDCLFDGTDRGIRIKTRRGRGGKVHDLLFKNITMKDNLCPLVINFYYSSGCPSPTNEYRLQKEEITEETPSVENVTIEGCVATGCRASAGFIVGLPEMPVKNVIVKDSHFSVAKDSDVDAGESAMSTGLPKPYSKGFRIRNAENVAFQDFTVDVDGEKILIENNVSLRT